MAKSANESKASRRAHPSFVAPSPLRGGPAAWGWCRLGPRALEADLDDLVGLGTARRRHLDALADLLADQRAGERRGYRQATGADIGLVLADDLEGLLLIGLLVGERHCRAELDHRAGQFRDVDDLGARDLVLQFHDAAFDEALAFARRMVLGVLREIAVIARLGNRSDDRRTIDRFEPLQFFLEAVVALRRHRNLFHS